MRVTKGALIVFLFLLGITFSLQNTEEVTISYHGLVDSVVAPLFIVVLASVCLGMIIGALASMATMIKLRAELKRENRELLKIRRELKLSEISASRTAEWLPSDTIRE